MSPTATGSPTAASLSAASSVPPRQVESRSSVASTDRTAASRPRTAAPRRGAHAVAVSTVPIA